MRLFSVTCVALCLATPASAYVRSRTSKGTPIRWRSAVTLTPAAHEGPDLSDDAARATFQRAIDNWRGAVAPCAEVTLQLGAPEELDAVFDDHKNVIIFRTDRWCHPDDGANVGVCHDPSATAITSVFYKSHLGHDDDGEITDTDVELNAINFTFVEAPSSAAPRPGTQLTDLENTVTHELGHVLGLSHTCADSSSRGDEIDDEGNPIPSCAALAGLTDAERAEVVDATMYNFISPFELETKKRTPETDDIAGVCEAYPRTGGCGCQTTPASVPWSLALLLAIALCVTRVSRA